MNHDHSVHRLLADCVKKQTVDCIVSDDIAAGRPTDHVCSSFSTDDDADDDDDVDGACEASAPIIDDMMQMMVIKDNARIITMAISGDQ